MNNTLVNGLRIIELLAHRGEPTRLTQVARELGLSKSNVHRLLQGLTELAYVVRDPEMGTYTASIRLWELGSAVLAKLDLRQHAERPMESIAQTTGESVHLSVLDHNEVVYVHKVESSNPIRAYTQIGGRAPIHCVATGKTMLAFQSREFILETSLHLKAFTSNTITDSDKLLQQIEQIRGRGYGVNRGEWREGVYGVGTAIFDSRGHVIAAIGVSGPAARFTEDSIEKFADLLQRAAHEIMSKLGVVAPQHLLQLGRQPIRSGS